MDTYRIITYLKSKGLICSQRGSDLIVTAKGINLSQIQVILSGEQNFFGGYNYNAIFTTNIIVQPNKKDKIIYEIIEKYGSSISCDISIMGNYSVLTLTASMISIDNKKPEVYCYDFLLKDFIEKIDESALIWNCSQ